MSDNNPRIEELRRRVLADPASIAFAALAEEYRRVGNFKEAIETCVAGLKRHPSYLSAHVTLGRSLIEVGRFDEAEQELQLVLKAAPENLAAIRGMAEIHHRRPDQPYDEAQALSHFNHQESEAAAAAPAPEPDAIEPPEPPPAPVAPPAYVPTPYEAPAWETLSFAPAGTTPAPGEPPATFVPPAQFETPAPFEPPAAFEPPATFSAPAAYETPAAFDPPQYDPPGTFEFPQSAAVPHTYEAPAAIAEVRHPELEALEGFLEAILASRAVLQAH